MILVDGAKVAGFLETKLGVKFSEPLIAFGFVGNDGRPLCAFVFNDKSDANIEMSAFAESGGITREVIRYIARYVFVQNNCRRLTVRTKGRNKRALKLIPRYGFQYECVAKHFFPDDDAVVFRMLKDECRWL